MTDLTTKPNAELAYRVLDLALANPDHLNMATWANSRTDGAFVGLDDLTGPGCGTTACYAGWTVAMHGFWIDKDGDVWQNGHLFSEDLGTFAATLLGITEEQEEDLFFADVDQLATKVAEIFGPRPDGGAS